MLELRLPLFGFNHVCPAVQVEFRSVVSTSKDLQFSVEVSKKWTMYLLFYEPFLTFIFSVFWLDITFLLSLFLEFVFI